MAWAWFFLAKKRCQLQSNFYICMFSLEFQATEQSSETLANSFKQQTTKGKMENVIK
jgi:hypothetical protein